MQNRRGYPKRGLHGEVVHRIALRILRGEVAPGAAFPNAADLSTELQVSRTSVREAIKVLAAKGLLESRPKTGTRVRPRSHWSWLDADVLAWQYEAEPDEQFLKNATEIRQVIEPAAAGLAAARATDAEIAGLEDAYRQMQLTVRDIESFLAADLHFHIAILTACHNELLDQMSSAIGTGLSASGTVTNQVPGAAAASLPLHHAVFQAIARRDVEAARAAMRDLVDRAASDIDQMTRAVAGMKTA
jgi:GntR family transcriptional regulator, galactonate operon transcriptional repressor